MQEGNYPDLCLSITSARYLAKRAICPGEAKQVSAPIAFGTICSPKRSLTKNLDSDSVQKLILGIDPRNLYLLSEVGLSKEQLTYLLEFNPRREITGDLGEM